MIVEAKKIKPEISFEQYLLTDVFSQMNIALKQNITLTARLKNKMPSKLREKLLLELMTVNKQMHLLNLLWLELRSEKTKTNHNVHRLLEELKNQQYMHYPESVLDLAFYKKQLQKSNKQPFQQLAEAYSTFWEQFNFEQHVYAEKSTSDKQAYMNALYTVAKYFGLDSVSSLKGIKKKLGVTQAVKKISYEQIKSVCTAEWTLTAKTIDCKLNNVYLLGEALLMIPHIINERFIVESELLNSLQLSKKEVEDIIHFTNLLKVDEFALTDPFLQIQKNSILNVYAKFFSQYAYKEMEHHHKVLVIGTMSSGKSTFLNSLIGQDLFPSKNEACTARIFNYSVKDTSSYTVRKGQSQHVDRFDTLSPNMISEWNDAVDKEPIQIIGPSKSAVKMNKKITFIDTPGPNNAADASHRQVMQTALDGEYEKILYLLNSTQLGTEDDVVLLNHLKELLKKKGDIPVYFIVNKVDEFDNDSNESIATLCENVQTYLQAKGFEQPNVLFVSALTFKLVQQEFNGDVLSRKERNQLRFFQDMMLESAYNLTQYNIYSKPTIPNNLQFNEQLTEHQIKLLIHSGMTEVLNCL